MEEAKNKCKIYWICKNNANIAREMEEGIRSQHLKLSPADIDKATLYILDSLKVWV